MKNNNFFSKIYLSTTSTSFYTSIIHERLIQSFLYLIILIILISIPYSIYSGINYKTISNHVVDIINTEDFPSFYLHEGKLEIHGDKPFVYSDDKTKSLKLIIDNTGSYTFNDLAGYYVGFLITPDNMIYSQAGMMPQSMKYNELLEFTLSREDLSDLVKTIQPWFSYGIGIFTIVFAILSALIKSLFSYLMVNFFKKSLNITLSSAQTFKIAIYSMTAPLIIINILQFMPSFIPSNFYFGIFVLINLIYIIKILKYFNNLKTNLTA